MNAANVEHPYLLNVFHYYTNMTAIDTTDILNAETAESSSSTFQTCDHQSLRE